MSRQKKSINEKMFGDIPPLSEQEARAAARQKKIEDDADEIFSRMVSKKAERPAADEPEAPAPAPKPQKPAPAKPKAAAAPKKTKRAASDTQPAKAQAGDPGAYALVNWTVQIPEWLRDALDDEAKARRRARTSTAGADGARISRTSILVEIVESELRSRGYSPEAW